MIKMQYREAQIISDMPYTVYIMQWLSDVLQCVSVCSMFVYYSQQGRWHCVQNGIVFLVRVCDCSDTTQNKRNNYGTGSDFFQCWWARWSTTYQAIPSGLNSYAQLCVLLLPGTITNHAVDTSSVCYTCQALQAERERDRHINIHAIVEEHKVLYQEEEYMKEIANIYTEEKIACMVIH